MPDILFHYDERGFISFISRIEDQIIPVIQSAINEWQKLRIGKLKSEDLCSLFTKTDDLIFEKVVGGKTLKIEGVTVKRSKAKDILEMPAGCAAFSIVINETKESLESELLLTYTPHRIWVNTFHKYFEITDQQTVVIKDSMKEKIKESFKYYAKTDRQKAVLAFTQDIISSYEKNGIKSIIGSNGDGVTGLLKRILDNPFMQGIKLNKDGILSC